eukprot:g29164.t1
MIPFLGSRPARPTTLAISAHMKKCIVRWSPHNPEELVVASQSIRLYKKKPEKAQDYQLLLESESDSRGVLTIESLQDEEAENSDESSQDEIGEAMESRREVRGGRGEESEMENDRLRMGAGVNRSEQEDASNDLLREGTSSNDMRARRGVTTGNSQEEKVSRAPAPLNQESFTVQDTVNCENQLIKCLDWFPQRSDPYLLAPGFFSGRVTLLRFLNQNRSIKEFAPRVARPCNAVAFNPVAPTKLAVGLDRARQDGGALIFDLHQKGRVLRRANAARVAEAHSSFVGSSEDITALSRSSFEHHHTTEEWWPWNGSPMMPTALLWGLRSSGCECTTFEAMQNPWLWLHTQKLFMGTVRIWDIRRAEREPIATVKVPTGVGGRATRGVGGPLASKLLLDIRWCRTRPSLLATLSVEEDSLRLWDVSGAVAEQWSAVKNVDQPRASSVEPTESPSKFKNLPSIRVGCQGIVNDFSWHPSKPGRIAVICGRASLQVLTVRSHAPVSFSPAGSLSFGIDTQMFLGVHPSLILEQLPTRNGVEKDRLEGKSSPQPSWHSAGQLLPSTAEDQTSSDISHIMHRLAPHFSLSPRRNAKIARHEGQAALARIWDWVSGWQERCADVEGSAAVHIEQEGGPNLDFPEANARQLYLGLGEILLGKDWNSSPTPSTVNSSMNKPISTSNPSHERVRAERNNVADSPARGFSNSSRGRSNTASQHTAEGSVSEATNDSSSDDDVETDAEAPADKTGFLLLKNKTESSGTYLLRSQDPSLAHLTVYYSHARGEALQLCKWANTISVQPGTTGHRTVIEPEMVEEVNLENRLVTLEHRGAHERACALALAHLKLQRAIQALSQGATTAAAKGEVDTAARYGLLALALSGYSNGAISTQAHSAGHVSLWEQTCQANLKHVLHRPYLRVTFDFLASDTNTIKRILFRKRVQLRDRMAFACRFLPDRELARYVRKCAQLHSDTGTLDGLVLTGLGPAAIPLLQAYLDRTADVQTVALLACYCLVHQAPAQDPRLLSWIDTYRRLLNQWGLWTLRARFDVARAVLFQRQGVSRKMLEDSKSARPLPPQNRTQRGGITNELGSISSAPPWASAIKPHVSPRCNYCGHSLGLVEMTKEKKKAAEKPPQRKPRRSATGIAASSQAHTRVSACPSCHKSLPRCSLCLVTLDCAAPPVENKQKSRQPREESAFSTASRHNFADWVTWCQRCRHVGHTKHLLEWFKTHRVCPKYDTEAL